MPKKLLWAFRPRPCEIQTDTVQILVPRLFVHIGDTLAKQTGGSLMELHRRILSLFLPSVKAIPVLDMTPPISPTLAGILPKERTDHPPVTFTQGI